MIELTYEDWLAELADWLNEDPAALEYAYPKLRELLYNAGMRPTEAADCIRTGM